MAEIFEIMMLVAFGLSWPLNLKKAIESKSTKGISLSFYFLILFGYVAGIISKFVNKSYMASINTKWYVLVFYFINFVVVGLNIIVFFINKNKEKENIQNNHH